MQQHQQARFALPPAEHTFRPTYRLYDGVRRVADLVFGLLGLVLCLPLMVVIGIAIKLDSPGPVFYRQRRVGRNRRRRQEPLELGDNVVRLNLRRANVHGQTFWMIKFRTMQADAEATTGAVWATENDPRVTRVGRFLRRTRLDELPQLWNVLCGHMTLIGPRPERPEFVAKFALQIAGYTDRLWVKPGITGLAQVRQGYDRCLEDVRRKLGHDLEYIRRRSLWLDLAICFATLRVVVSGRGSH